MGKRTIRIPSHVLTSKAASLVGEEAHVILQNGQTYFGNVTAADDESLSIVAKSTVWYNLSSHTHRLLFTTIQEVIVDKVTEW